MIIYFQRMAKYLELVFTSLFVMRIVAALSFQASLWSVWWTTHSRKKDSLQSIAWNCELRSVVLCSHGDVKLLSRDRVPVSPLSLEGSTIAFSDQK